jgi:hypothetical protein
MVMDAIPFLHLVSERKNGRRKGRKEEEIDGHVLFEHSYTFACSL